MNKHIDWQKDRQIDRYIDKLRESERERENKRKRDMKRERSGLRCCKREKEKARERGVAGEGEVERDRERFILRRCNLWPWCSWCSGYHICLTHRRSQVRALVSTASFLSLFINRDTIHRKNAHIFMVLYIYPYIYIYKHIVFILTIITVFLSSIRGCMELNLFLFLFFLLSEL